MLIIFTESVLLFHFKGFILEIKTRQYKRKEVRVVLLHLHKVIPLIWVFTSILLNPLVQIAIVD